MDWPTWRDQRQKNTRGSLDSIKQGYDWIWRKFIAQWGDICLEC